MTCHDLPSRPLEPVAVAATNGRRTRRRGVTLLETLLALTLFVGALAALGQLVLNGMQAAAQVRLRTQAILRCESKLAELVVGAEPLQSVSDAALPEDSRWTWSTQVVPSPHPGLLNVEVTVSRPAGDQAAAVTYSLKRLIRDPHMSPVRPPQ